MHYSSHLPFCARDFKPIVLKPLSLGVPELVSLFGDNPPDSRIDIVEAARPDLLIHFCHESAHRNSRSPNHDVNNPRIRHNQPRITQPLRHLDERRHPETLVVNGLLIEQICRELLLDSFAARDWNRI